MFNPLPYLESSFVLIVVFFLGGGGGGRDLFAPQSAWMVLGKI